jgi:fructosamine-3-kinase
MKTAYELAMERLNQSAPTKKLNEDQKKEIAELESQYAAKIAGREVFLKTEIQKAMERADAEALEQLEKQLVNERKALHADLEEKKDKVRNRS